MFALLLALALPWPLRAQPAAAAFPLPLSLPLSEGPHDIQTAAAMTGEPAAALATADGPHDRETGDPTRWIGEGFTRRDGVTGPDGGAV